MTTKRIILAFFSVLLSIFAASAQEQTDSLANVIYVDSTYVNKDILDVMPSRIKGDFATVSVSQSESVGRALRQKIVNSSLGQIDGYRVRIFFSNAQNAREMSEIEMRRFTEVYNHRAYRSFVSPNFKVTVGDFRTRSEALRLLAALRKDFPAAFIVKEKVNIVY